MYSRKEKKSFKYKRIRSIGKFIDQLKRQIRNERDKSTINKLEKNLKQQEKLIEYYKKQPF